MSLIQQYACDAAAAAAVLWPLTFPLWFPCFSAVAITVFDEQSLLFYHKWIPRRDGGKMKLVTPRKGEEEEESQGKQVKGEEDRRWLIVLI